MKKAVYLVIRNDIYSGTGEVIEVNTIVYVASTSRKALQYIFDVYHKPGVKVVDDKIIGKLEGGQDQESILYPERAVIDEDDIDIEISRGEQ